MFRAGVTHISASYQDDAQRLSPGVGAHRLIYREGLIHGVIHH